MSSQAKLDSLLTGAEIQAAVKRLASEITRDYQDKYPLLISILKGSFIFMADLVRYLDFPLELDFIRLTSYGDKTHTSGEVKMVQSLSCPVAGRHVLLIEDIVDTGITIGFLTDFLQKEKPVSVRLCVLADKPSRRRVPVSIDYLGFTVPDKFLVGYGLDCGEKYRNLPDICFLETEA